MPASSDSMEWKSCARMLCRLPRSEIVHMPDLRPGDWLSPFSHALVALQEPAGVRALQYHVRLCRYIRKAFGFAGLNPKAAVPPARRPR